MSAQQDKFLDVNTSVLMPPASLSEVRWHHEQLLQIKTLFNQKVFVNVQIYRPTHETFKWTISRSSRSAPV